jgi:hypothetical protein
MRITIELDDRIVKEIKNRAKSSGRTIKEVINQELATVFFPEKQTKKKFKVTPHSSTFKEGVDQEKI